jgi:cell division protein FtsZ
MSIKISLPEDSEMKPKITVFGVGGAGGNAVNNMIHSALDGVEFWIANTDAQAIDNSATANRIQLGAKSTRGLGAGSHPEIGKKAAEESLADINSILEGTNMVFITAGMGGGTGTGAGPIIAKAAKEKGILTVGVVTKPFHFEGARRMKVAELGLEEMNKYVDTLIVIPNQNLFRLANENTTFADAFRMADNVLHSGVRGITDLITMPGLINLDFADIRTVMSEMGKAMMGTGEAEGEDRAVLAAEAAISNPLLDNSSMKGAKGVLINITGGSDMTLFQVDAAANRIREEVDPNANIIFGSAFNPDLQGKIRVSLVATGIDSKSDNKAGFKPTVATVAEPERIPTIMVKSESFESSIPSVIPSNIFTKAASDLEANFNSRTPIVEDNAFIPPSPQEPSAYLKMGDAFTEHNSSANSEMSLMGHEFEEELNIAANTSQQIKSVSSKEGNAAEKQKEDFFDIPAFLRKKMKF